MRSKLPGYLLLSCISFGFFTCIFHAVAHAQTPVSAAVQTPAQKSQPPPTIYIAQTNPEVNNQQSQQQAPVSPTPTVYQAPLKNSLASLDSATPEVKQPTTTPVPTQKAPEPTPTVAPTTVPVAQTATAAPTDLDSLFTKYSGEYGVDKELLKKIAKCESGFNPTSNNSGMYLGMFQFASSTWVANRNRMGLDANPDLRTNAEEAIRTAAYVISKSGAGAWPVCSK